MGWGGDPDESSLDAMFHAVRLPETGWSKGERMSNGRPIFKAVFLLTDASYKSSFDGKTEYPRGTEEYDCQNGVGNILDQKDALVNGFLLCLELC